MPYRVVEYAPARQRHSKRPSGGRSCHTVYYGGRNGYGGRLIPRSAHARLVSVPPPSRFVRSQDIYSLGEEAYRLPYRTKVVHIEDLSNYGNHYHDNESCMDLQLYDTEADIRRDASDILLRLAYGVPVPSYKNIPLRSSSELRDIVDVRRKFVRDRNNLSSMSRIQSEIYRMAMYQEPLRKPLSGKGNLACLSFAGGRPISKRQLRFVPEDNGIRDVINFRSFYNNLRVAATLGTFYKKPATYQPLYKSRKSLLGIKDSEEKEEKPRKEVESKWMRQASSDANEGYKSRPVEKSISKAEVQQSYVLPSPRKSIIEVPEEAKSLSEPEPEVVVKISRKSIQEDHPIFTETQETIRISPLPVEEVKDEAEPEEVFEDAEEPKPLTPEVQDEVHEAAPEELVVEEPCRVEEAPEEHFAEPEAQKVDEVEDQIEEAQPEVDDAEVLQNEPATVEDEQFEEAVEQNEVMAPSPERAESRNAEVASPMSNGDYKAEEIEDAVDNGQAGLISEDEQLDELENIRSPPPTKMTSDDESLKIEDAHEIANGENNNCADEEAPAPSPPTAENDNVNDEGEEVKVDDAWWNTDGDTKGSRYQAKNLDNDDEEPDDTANEELEEKDDVEEEESECEESE